MVIWRGRKYDLPPGVGRRRCPTGYRLHIELCYDVIDRRACFAAIFAADDFCIGDGVEVFSVMDVMGNVLELAIDKGQADGCPALNRYREIAGHVGQYGGTDKLTDAAVRCGVCDFG